MISGVSAHVERLHLDHVLRNLVLEGVWKVACSSRMRLPSREGAAVPCPLEDPTPPSGFPLARLGALLKAGLAGRDQGCLGHGQESVEEGQRDDDRDLEREVGHLGIRSFP
jgi:hypothetical protein